MFADLFKRLSAPAPEIDTLDAQRALGALLVRIARTDGEYAPAEIARIDLVLSDHFGLSAADAAALRAECEQVESEAPDTVRFTRALKDAVDFEDRAGIVAAMWQVVLADGSRDQGEDALMRMVSSMLGLTDQESNALRRDIAARD